MAADLATVEHGGLLRIEEARRILAECVDLDDLKAIRDGAKATAAYYRERGAALEIQNDAAELRLRAERRLGELLRDMPKNPGGDPSKRNDQPPTLGEIGITRAQSSTWQRIATLAEEEFNDRIAEAKENGLELTTSRMLKGVALDRAAAKPGDDSPRSARERVLEAIIAVREAKDHRDEWWSSLLRLRSILEAVPEPKTEATTQQVWVAMEQLEDASEFEDAEYHRAWERFRNAALNWLASTAGGKGQLRTMYREGQGVHRATAVKR